MALVKEYFELTKKYQEEYGENTLLLMQVGSFFEVYAICDKKTNTITGSKISDFSLICELNMVDKNVCVGKDNVLMAGFKDIMIEKYLRKMQDAGFTVVVYTQDQAAKNTSRSCAGIFSPGTYFSSEPTRLTNNLTCIWVDLIENNSEWILDASKFELQENTLFENYDDHRIAMALAILAFIKPIQMENLEAVNKSYPDFWEHLRTLKS